MSNSNFLELPFLAAAQNQKHITMNECLNKLDIVVQLSVKSKVLIDKPTNPNEGDRYIIGDFAINDWNGFDQKIAIYQDGAWKIVNVKKGWICWIENEQKIYIFAENSWEGNAP